MCDPAPRERFQKHVSLAPETHNRVHLYGMSLSVPAFFSHIYVPLHCRAKQKIEVHRICEAPDQVSRVCEVSLPSSFPIPGSANVMPGDALPGGLPRAEQSESGVFADADQGSACKGTQQSNTAQTGVQGPQQTAPAPDDGYTLVGKRHTQAHDANRREPTSSPVIHQTVWTALLPEQSLDEPAVNGSSGPVGDQACGPLQLSTVVSEDDYQLEMQSKDPSPLPVKYRRCGHCATRFRSCNSLHRHLLNCTTNTGAGALIRSMIDSQPVVTCSRIIQKCWEQHTWGDCQDCPGDHSCIDQKCAAVYVQHSVNKLCPPHIFQGTLAGQDTSAQAALVLAVGSLAFRMLGTPLLAMSMYVMTRSRPGGTYPPIPCQDGELSPPLRPVAREDSPVFDQHYAVAEEILLNALDVERPGDRDPGLYEHSKLRQKQLNTLWGTAPDGTAEESDAITDECVSDHCGEESA